LCAILDWGREIDDYDRRRLGERARAVGRMRVKCNGYQISVTQLARLSTLEIRGEGLAGL
jgi:hypothetical protein